MSQTNSLSRDLTTGNVTKQLLSFALPFVLSSILQTAYNLVDMIVVGQFVGSVGLSAVSIGGQVTNLLTHLGLGFASGGQILIAQLMGVKDRDGIKHTIGTLFTALSLLSIVLGTLGCIFCRPLLGLLNTPEEAMGEAISYLFTCCLGMFFIYGYNVVSSILRGLGNSRWPFIFIAIASVVNLILDLFFVAVLHMGTFGAALATVMGQAVSFIIAIIYLYRSRESFGFDFKLKSFAIDKSKLKPLVRLGIPLALQSCITISMMFVDSFINAYGLVAAAVNGVGGKLYGLMSIIASSVEAAGGTMIGQNMAAGKLDRVKKILGVSYFICIAFFLVTAIAALFFPKEIFSVFNNEPEVLAMAPMYMRISIIMYLGFALMAPSLALINGVGFASLSLIIALLDGVVFRIGLSLLLGIGMNMGLPGFFLGSALASHVSVIMGGIYMFGGKWKKRRLLVDSPAAT